MEVARSMPEDPGPADLSRAPIRTTSGNAQFPLARRSSGQVSSLGLPRTRAPCEKQPCPFARANAFRFEPFGVLSRPSTWGYRCGSRFAFSRHADSRVFPRGRARARSRFSAARASNAAFGWSSSVECFAAECALLLASAQLGASGAPSAPPSKPPATRRPPRPTAPRPRRRRSRTARRAHRGRARGERRREHHQPVGGARPCRTARASPARASLGAAALHLAARDRYVQSHFGRPAWRMPNS